MMTVPIFTLASSSVAVLVLHVLRDPVHTAGYQTICHPLKGPLDLRFADDGSHGPFHSRLATEVIDYLSAKRIHCSQ